MIALDRQELEIWTVFAAVCLHAQATGARVGVQDVTVESAAKAADKMVELRRLRMPKREP